jgi:hypothetical protein
VICFVCLFSHFVLVILEPNVSQLRVRHVLEREKGRREREGRRELEEEKKKFLFYLHVNPLDLELTFPFVCAREKVEVRTQKSNNWRLNCSLS